eukprot:scaffold4822_cov60-Phaeocystis_antarctica.AAC.1
MRTGYILNTPLSSIGYYITADSTRKDTCQERHVLAGYTENTSPNLLGIALDHRRPPNFVVAVDIPTDRNPDYWVSMGAAMLCALAD